MKASETLAKRGHSVILLERHDRLGGQINLIARTPGREGLTAITEDLMTHMGKHGVEIRTETEATPELIQDLAPDSVILATGATPARTEQDVPDGQHVSLSSLAHEGSGCRHRRG